MEGGGAERQLSMLAAEQRRRGESVCIGVRRGGIFEAPLRDSEVPISFLGDHPGFNPVLLARICTLIRKVRPDVVQTWLPQMDIVGGLAAVALSVPWVIAERSSKAAYLGLGLTETARLRLARFSRAIVANSTGGVAYWREKTGGRLRVEKVSNAVDVTAIRAAASGPGELSANAGKPLLVVGRLAPEKALEIVVEAVKLVAQRQTIEVLFIGEGPLRTDLQKMIADAGLDTQCALIPFRDDWWRLLGDASAVVSASRYEGEPNVVLEAMAAGCPLIVSDIPAHRAILHDESALLVPVDDSAALARAMASVLTHPEPARVRAACAAARADTFTIAAAAEGYESIYRRIMSAQPA